MIDIKVKIHDKYAFEFKISFIVNGHKKEDISEFSINTWLFVPNSLDINMSTYSKEQFFKDVKSNVRLITPIFTLKQIYNKDNGPLRQLKDAFLKLADNPESEEAIENYSYQVRIFSCICKSALRDRAYFIREITDDKAIIDLTHEYIVDTKAIISGYRELWTIIAKEEISKDLKEQFYFADEFLGNIVEQQIFRLMRGIKDNPSFVSVKQGLVDLLQEEIDYKKKKHYAILEEENSKKNYLVIMRRGILKKFIESDLYLNTKKTKDGEFVKQFYYGMAAGVAMIFATIVAFTAQMRYGNFTMPLFFALVVSYIFKDRIKDLMRYYFSTQLGKKYYDTKRQLEIRKNKIGWTKEAFDFASEDKVPPEVINLRKRSPLVEAENKIYNEQILLYKKLVNLSPSGIDTDKYYKFSGINDITRFNIMYYIMKTDDPYISLYLPDEDDGYRSFEGEKVYSMHFVLRCESKNNLYYRTFRLLFNRDGIQDITEIRT